MESELEIIKRKMLKEMLLKEGATKRERPPAPTTPTATV